MDIVRIAEDIASQELSTRAAYARRVYPDFVSGYPTLCGMICRDADFDMTFLRRMVHVFDNAPSPDAGFDTISGELQQKYLCPVIERLERERLQKDAQ
jgi:hypothetical protein